MTDIRTKPSSQAYRDNYDAIFGSKRDEAALAAAYDKADREVWQYGMCSLATLSLIDELGGDTSNYE